MVGFPRVSVGFICWLNGEPGSAQAWNSDRVWLTVQRSYFTRQWNCSPHTVPRDICQEQQMLFPSLYVSQWNNKDFADCPMFKHRSMPNTTDPSYSFLRLRRRGSILDTRDFTVAISTGIILQMVYPSSLSFLHYIASLPHACGNRDDTDAALIERVPTLRIMYMVSE
jgi:hypothetical protein